MNEAIVESESGQQELRRAASTDQPEERKAPIEESKQTEEPAEDNLFGGDIAESEEEEIP